MANILKSLWNDVVQLLENWAIFTPETSAQMMSQEVISDKQIRDLVNKVTNKVKRMRDIDQAKLDDLWTKISQMSSNAGSPDLNDYIAKTKREMKSTINGLRKDITNYDIMENTIATAADDFRSASTKYRTNENEDWQDLKKQAQSIDKFYEEKVNDKKENN